MSDTDTYQDLFFLDSYFIYVAFLSLFDLDFFMVRLLLSFGHFLGGFIEAAISTCII